MSELYNLLKDARKKVAFSWGKGRRYYERPGNSCCAAEAIENSIEWGPLRNQAYRLIEKCAGISGMGEYQEGGAQDQTIVGWNDAPERTQVDVLKVYDHAIAIVKDLR